jgi:hypothetical protein
VADDFDERALHVTAKKSYSTQEAALSAAYVAVGVVDGVGAWNVEMVGKFTPKLDAADATCLLVEPVSYERASARRAKHLVGHYPLIVH